MKIDVDRLETVTLRPGDVLVLTVPGVVSQEAAQRIRDGFRKTRGDQVEVLVLAGMTLSVVREGEAA
jgi:hypothetical protein